MTAAKRRVYVDACVLILAAKASESEIAIQALEQLNQENVEYLFSSIVELETIPQPTLNKRNAEVAFFKGFFEDAERVVCAEEQQQQALILMCAKHGLTLADAMHVSCAIAAGAQELITAETVAKPMVQAPVDAAVLQIRTIRVETAA